MATVLLSAAGAALGGSIGGTVAGLSKVAVGRLVGATLGRAIDQRIMGQGSDVVESGRVDRFRITGAAEGNAIARVHGQMRVGGQVIWASRFSESVLTSGGGKGLSPQPSVREYSYSVSLAIALCEGEITRVGRVWADGMEISPDDLNMRVYTGTRDQLPDPKIEAVEGTGRVPAYRGTAYLVLEDLQLEPFGNRVPQFSFEVFRPAPVDQQDAQFEPAHAVRGVALIPGTGEYSLSTTPVYYRNGPGESWAANLNTPSGKTDFETSLEALDAEMPNYAAVSLIVSWFGSDLRCAACDVQPRPEQTDFEGSMPWRVAGLGGAEASAVATSEGRPVYGGTPSDGSVIEAIRRMNDMGKNVTFYPFILMEQLADNGLPDPWSDASDQPVLPWRGRITLSKAPGQPGSPDRSAQADSEVADFFGAASAADFEIANGQVSYSGPAEWRYRRFILHYAALCKAAGGVGAFCIGSEMRALTQIRGAGDVFAVVEQMRGLAADVRAILGPDVKIGYAADWSEYFGYHPQDGSGDVYFHLDPLWADDAIDFVGIDNYMPLSDWRDGDAHADAVWGTIYNPAYLKANVAGGEGYDWFYHSPEAEAAQICTPITDGAYDEPWVFRHKDIRNWWMNEHHERIGGVRQETPTAWKPQSKPIWFTELGCAAIDKGTNQPNKFLDPKSSESRLPSYSNGRRDDFIQRQYLRAIYDHWGDPAQNPVSPEYGGPMVDMARAHVWAWDARPFPHFPNNRELWSDGDNYRRGHWLNGRVSNRSLASVVREICERAGVLAFDVDDLRGVVRGFAIGEVADARTALQPLMLQHGFDAVDREGVLTFMMRDGRDAIAIARDDLAMSGDLDGVVSRTRGSEADMSGRVQVGFVQAGGDYDMISEEAVLPRDDACSHPHRIAAIDDKGRGAPSGRTLVDGGACRA
ncbi:Putative phage tail protein [Salinihabitans flavidus]|uniref:Putative phage tail protein n=1 Tax=Salinihabitans flavidus TaxID=569882 RepID=A0A1H8QAG1_9RHOB|nr:Putative phage tail protein [Salinihabitans flavidus]